MPQHEGEGQKTTFKSLFSSSTMMVLEIKPRSAISLAPSYAFFHMCVSDYVCLLSPCGSQGLNSDGQACRPILAKLSHRHLNILMRVSFIIFQLLWLFSTFTSICQVRPPLYLPCFFSNTGYVRQALDHYTVLQPLCFVRLAIEKKMKHQIMTKKSVWPLKNWQHKRMNDLSCSWYLAYKMTTKHHNPQKKFII